MDESRQILYTLAGQSTIEVMYLGTDGKSFCKIARISDVFPYAQRALEIYPYSGQLDRKSFRIISIHPILVAESKQIHLVAITSSGLCFIVDKSSQGSDFISLATILSAVSGIYQCRKM